jgi:hypothetical protein
MLKGTISLLLIAVVIWAFWMSYQWLRNPNNRTKKQTKNK